jgi:hypothetical protein
MTANPREPVSVDDWDAIDRSFLALGAVHITGAIEPTILESMRGAYANVFREWKKLADENALPDHLIRPYKRGFAHLANPAFDSKAVGALVPETFRRAARSYLGSEPQIDGSSHVRSITIARPDAHLPFHQDQTVLKRPVVNIWIPLDACGESAPGLELVVGVGQEQLVPSPPKDPYFFVERAQLDEAEIRSRFGAEAFWTPIFKPGDAMLFVGSIIHRTYARPAMTLDRMSVEVRLR